MVALGSVMFCRSLQYLSNLTDFKAKFSLSRYISKTKYRLILEMSNKEKKEMRSTRTKRSAEGSEQKESKRTKITKTESKPAKPKLNKASTEYDDTDFNKCETGKPWNYKISSWNVDGVRAWMGKGGLEFLEHEKPDIFCLQELKCEEKKIPKEILNISGYNTYLNCGNLPGYAGVALYSKKPAINVTNGMEDKEDNEGRIITAEFDDFFIISVYVPNSGRKLVTLPKRLTWNETFREHVKKLDAIKPVIICGDMNVSHKEIDLANPKSNKRNAGFTVEERSGMDDLLGDGFVDSYRKLYPDKTDAYTFWSFFSNSRAKNIGWRLDYHIVSKRFADSVIDSVIRSQVYGSDHCPITLFANVK